MRRSLLSVPVAAACFALWSVVPVGSDGATTARLQERIDDTEQKIGKKKRTEQVLTSQVSAATARIDRLQGRIDVYRGRQADVQADLDRASAELERIQRDLRHEQARKVRLDRRLRQARTVLAARLVARYEADTPDLVGVVLNSHGFADLIERAELLRRIGRQDQRIVTTVRSARAEARANAARLGTLQVSARRVAARIQARRDEIRAVADGLDRTQSGFEDVKAQKAALLRGVRGDRHDLEEDLSSLRKEQAKIEGTLSSAASTGAAPKGTGQMVWPVQGPLTSPYCETRSWESCHPGIDIGVPTGTPIHAADSGRVALAAWTGGYGNYTCIQHSASLSTCYGHQSAYRVSAGQNVRKGQVIGLSGSTGMSTGPHLHFEVRIDGAVTNPLSYL